MILATVSSNNVLVLFLFINGWLFMDLIADHPEPRP
jgi:hypothetical protein